MHKQELSNALHVGGSIETALNGKYSLNASAIVQEAVKLTQKHFWRFLPATLIFSLANILLFFIVLAVQTDDPFNSLQAFVNTQEQSVESANHIKTAMFLSTVFSAPFYAGASLMGLSHAVGFKTQPYHLIKGFNYGATTIIAMLAINLLQNLGNRLSPILGLLIGVSLSMTLLLICEKRLSLTQAMLISLRATVKKALPFISVYFVLAGMFLFSYATAGIALIWVLPFMFNVKGVLYREMFGAGIEVVISQDEDPEDKIFHA